MGSRLSICLTLYVFTGTDAKENADVHGIKKRKKKNSAGKWFLEIRQEDGNNVHIYGGSTELQIYGNMCPKEKK